MQINDFTIGRPALERLGDNRKSASHAGKSGQFTEAAQLNRHFAGTVNLID